jgi:uncharacterized small protein (DUF1192 family)
MKVFDFDATLARLLAAAQEPILRALEEEEERNALLQKEIERLRGGGGACCGSCGSRSSSASLLTTGCLSNQQAGEDGNLPRVISYQGMTFEDAVYALRSGGARSTGMVPATRPEAPASQSKEKAGAATPAPNQDRTEGV